MTEREARAGARIIAWSEGNGQVLEEDAPALIERGRGEARRLGVELAMALMVFHHRQGPARIENKVVWVRPSGEVAWEYRKAHPVPGLEAASSIRGDGRIRYVDTAFGRVGVSICFDGDFPAQIREARRAGVEVLFSPSYDWRAITPQHSQMISYRAIELGMTYVRQTNRGLSLVTDPYGRTLAWMNQFSTADRVLVAHVPTRGVGTLYTLLGDWFALICVAASLAMVAYRKALSRRDKP